MESLLRKLKANKLNALTVDRRSVFGSSKASSSSLETLEATYDSSETEDETWSSSSSSTESVEDEEESFWLSMLLARIKEASNIENVILHDEVLTTRTTTQEHLTFSFSQLLRTLLHLPKLQSLRIYLSRRYTMDYSVLKQVVQDCPQLAQLVICDGSMWEEQHPEEIAFALTTRRQVQELGGTIRNHPSLVEVSFQECFVAPHLSIDPIVQALATLPKLEMINITLTQSSVKRLLDTSVVKLFSAQKLQDVTLWSMGLDDQHMEAIRDVLPAHSSLVFLSLRCNPKISAQGWQTICDMVERNFMLRSVYTDEIVSPERENLLQTFLYWNQCGRAALLQSHDPQQWQETIRRWNNDPSALYYIMRQGHSCLLSKK